MKRFLVIILVAVAALSLPAGAQPLPPPMPPLDPALIAAVEAQGTARVMVKFAVPGYTRSPGETADLIKLTRLGLLSDVRTRSAAVDLVANSEEWTIPYAAFEVDAAGLQALAASFGVIGISLDDREYRHLESALPLVNVDDAHARGTGTGYTGLTGVGWTVVVLDDGIQADHPFFGGRIVDEACFSTIDPGTSTTSLCPNGQTQQFGPGAAYTMTRCGSECNHGTHVMGIAIGKDGTRSGVAPGATGIMINVFSKDNVGSYTNVSDQVGALQHVQNDLVFDYQIASVNMSLGGGLFTGACDADANVTQQARIDAINALTSGGVAVVISSGNNGSTTQISRPACITAAMAVSAVDDSKNVASFSNVSEMVDFFAPGVNITSSVPGSTFGTLSGTSHAAPFVAGAWAVIKQAVPNASVPEVKNALELSGIPIDDNRGGGTQQDIPLIQIDDAIDVLRPVEDQVFNGDMEALGAPGVPSGWKKSGNVKRKCNTDTKTVTPFGDCAVKLKGGDVKTRLRQVIDSPRGTYDDQLTLRAQVKARNIVGGDLILRVNYALAGKAKIKVALANPDGTYDWTLQSSNPYVLNDSVIGLTVEAKAKPGGKFFVDQFALLLLPTLVDND